MPLITLSKRQLTTIQEHQAVIETEIPACLAVLYEFNKILVEKHRQITRHRMRTNSAPQRRNMAHSVVSDQQNASLNFDEIARSTLRFTTIQKSTSHTHKSLRDASCQKPSDSESGATAPIDTADEHTHESQQAIEGYYYFHVTSKSHVDAHILKRDEVKLIFEKECIHYARVFEIALTNYCIMDNHFHLKIGVPANGISFEDARKRCAKAVGCIKQQFTNRFKVWYNIEYRREKGHRIPKLGGGSMWAGSLHVAHIHDEAYLAKSTIYVEANRIKISCAELIEQLDSPPQITDISADVCYGFTKGYDKLFRTLIESRFQSAQAYLNEELRHTTALTDGRDGVWATPEEVEKLWHLPACKLPAGCRKVHVNQERRILKTTPPNLRTYHTTPFFKRLGQTPLARQQNFAQLVLTCCWKNRGASCPTNYVVNTEPGVHF